MAVIRQDDTGSQVEFPEGKILARASRQAFKHLRFSPDGRHLALLRLLTEGDNAGSLLLMDSATGESRVLSGPWPDTDGPVWRPDGREIWFAAARTGVRHDLLGVDLQGKERTVLTAPAGLRIDDVASDGRALLAQTEDRRELLAWEAGAPETKRLTISSFSILRDFTPDGRLALFDDEGTSDTAPNYPLYLSPTDGSLPTPIGRGQYGSISPDGKEVLVWRKEGERYALVLVPVAGGAERLLPTADIEVDGATWTPEGEILAIARQGKELPRLWKLAPGGAPVPAGPPTEGLWYFAGHAFLDGHRALIRLRDRSLVLIDVDAPDRPPEKLAWKKRPEDLTIGGSADGAWLYVAASPRRSLEPNRRLDLSRVERVDVRSGRREPFRKIDLPGVQDVFWVAASEDGSRFVGQQLRNSGHLFLVEGLM